MSCMYRLDEQLTYYRARAPEYDAWALREGPFDRGRDNAKWFAEIAKLEEALERFNPTGKVLQPPGGTGQWTERLVRHADELTVVDASEEVLEMNRQRVGDGVRHIQADLFSWKPDRRYDVVFFSFWLSHVPPELFQRFWDLVATALRPGGRVFFIDNIASGATAELDPEHLGPEERSLMRRLSDGPASTSGGLHGPEQLVRAARSGLGCRCAPDRRLLPLRAGHASRACRLLAGLASDVAGGRQRRVQQPVEVLQFGHRGGIEFVQARRDGRDGRVRDRTATLVADEPRTAAQPSDPLSDQRVDPAELFLALVRRRIAQARRGTLPADECRVHGVIASTGSGASREG